MTDQEMQTLLDLHSTDEMTSWSAYVKVYGHSVTKIRFTRSIQPATIPWAAGDELWLRSVSFGEDGDIRSNTYGTIPAGFFDVVERIDA